MITVLVLASSPQDQGPLHLGKEDKIIKHSRDSANNRDQFRIMSCMATTVDDLRKYLLEYTPTIVHFCGHGAGQQGLCFENDDGTTHPVNGERLAKLFHLVNEHVNCVVLNACFSEVQAEAISEHVDFVVGMKDEIGDAAAIKFAQGFYEAVWAGQSFEKAFKFGCSAIDTANIPQEHVPVILKSPRLGSERLEYSETTQDIENFILRYVNSGPSERAAMSISGATLLPIIEERTSSDPPKVWSSVSVIHVGSLHDDYKKVRAYLRRGLDGIEHTFYLQPLDDGFLMDWEATMGYWPIPFKTFKALGCRGTLRVRVTATLSDCFNYGYGKNDFVSLDLEEINRGSIHGYIHHAHEDFQALVDLLYDGRSHRVTLEIYPADGETSHVRITKYVTDSWVVSKPAVTEND